MPSSHPVQNPDRACYAWEGIYLECWTNHSMQQRPAWIVFEHCQFFIRVTMHLEFMPNMLHHLGCWHVETVQSLQCGASHANGCMFPMKLFDQLCHSGQTGVTWSSKKRSAKNSTTLSRWFCCARLASRRQRRNGVTSKFCTAFHKADLMVGTSGKKRFPVTGCASLAACCLLNTVI